MAQIPKLNKLLPLGFGEGVFFNDYHRVSANNNYTITYTNPNDYAIDVVAIINAGSGDTHEGTRTDWNRIYVSRNDYYYNQYTLAGRVGNNLSISLQEAGQGARLLHTAWGGYGTRGDIHRANQKHYQYQRKGDDHSHMIHDWHYFNLNWHCRQSGESLSTTLTLKPKASLHFNIIYRGAYNAPFKGSFCISALV